MSKKIQYQITADNTGFTAAMDASAAKMAELKDVAVSVKERLDGLLGGIAAFGGSELLHGIAEATIKFQSYQYTLDTATKSQADAAKEMQFVLDTAMEFGTNLDATASAYARMAFEAGQSGTSTKQLRAVFTAVSGAMRVLHLDQLHTKNVFLALTEIMGMPTVPLRILNRQLQFDFPGAVTAAAQGMGITTSQMRKMAAEGKLLSKDFIPGLTNGLNQAFGAQFKEASAGAQASFERMYTSWQEIENAIGNSGLVDAMASIANGVSDVSRAFGANEVPTKKAAMSAADFGEVVRLIGIGLAFFKGELEVAGRQIGAWAAIVANTIEDISAGKFAKIVSDFHTVSTSYQDDLKNINDQFDKTYHTLMNPPSLRDPLKDPAGDLKHHKKGKSDTSTKPGTSRVGDWEQVLTARKTAFETMQQQEGTAHTYSVAAEAAYWQKILQRTDLNGQERVAVERKWLAAEQHLRHERAAAHRKALTAEHQLQQQEATAFLAALKEKESAYKNNQDARLAIARTAQTQARQRYGEDSKEYQQVSQQIVQIERAKQQQLQTMQANHAQAQEQLQLNAVNFAQQQAQGREQRGKITQAQLLAQDELFEEQKYQIQLEYLQLKLQAMKGDTDADPVAKQQLDDKLLALQQQYQQKLIALQTENTGSFGKGKNPIASTVQGMTTSWAGGLQEMMQGTLNFQRGLQLVWLQMEREFLSLGIRKTVNWIASETAQTAATSAAAAQQGAIQTAAAAEGLAIKAEHGLKEIAIDAYKAMAGAFAAIAAIPYVGPFLAPAAAIAAGAAVFEIGSKIASAEGGYDVPAGLNPITQLHASEMVLPAPIANTVRDAVGGDGGGSTQPFHLTIQAVDGASVKRMFLDNPDAFVAALRKAQLNFQLPR